MDRMVASDELQRVLFVMRRLLNLLLHSCKDFEKALAHLARTIGHIELAAETIQFALETIEQLDATVGNQMAALPKLLHRKIE